MSHSYGTFRFPVLSPSAFSPFPPLDVILIEQSLRVYGFTLIRHYSHSLYSNPLGFPISIQIPLSIQGNNINHIISYQDDKVGLALSVSCRESCTSFFYWIWPDALAFMLVVMSCKLLFDIQIMSEEGGGGGFSPELQGCSENCNPPNPPSPTRPWWIGFNMCWKTKMHSN